MKSTDHAAFQKFIKENNIITDAYRISGEGCYLLKVHVPTHESLSLFLDNLLKFGNYRVNMSISKLK